MRKIETIGDFVQEHKRLCQWHAYCENARNMAGTDQNRALYARQMDGTLRSISALEERNPEFASALHYTLAAVRPRLAMVMRETRV